MAPIAKGSHFGKSSLKWVVKKKKLVTMKKKMSKLRAKLNHAKESLEKDKAEVKEKELKCAEERRLIELRSKEKVCNDRCIVLTLDIFDAEDKGDIARAQLLKQSRSELLTKQMEEIEAFKNGCGGLNSSEMGT